ncbi:MAG TPA: hypothetical protein VGS20_01640 [Candidatus Acidoferrales bacterium]|nr:hypothetical protein [Candidatus Acidoferrales bacterium]
METNNRLDICLNDTHELETFLHAFLGKLDPRKLKAGDDVTGYAKEFGLELPSVLKGATVKWEGCGESGPEPAGGPVRTLVLAQPGHPDAVGLVIKCVAIRRWRICLECGWFWCRIVITTRF